MSRGIIDTDEMTKGDLESLGRLTRRFPELLNQVEHSACIMAAQSLGEINIRITVSKRIKGWHSYVTLYSPLIEGFSQCFCLNNEENHSYKDEYPPLFETIDEAYKAAQSEREKLAASQSDLSSP